MRFSKILSMSIAGALGFLGAVPANAQLVCGERNHVVRNLYERYGETSTFMGVAGNGVMVEVFTSDDETFTVLVTRPDGMSCLMVSGDGWTPIAAKPPET